MGFAASATFFTVGGTSDGLLRFFDAAGSLIHTEALPAQNDSGKSTAIQVMYGKLDTRPFIVVGTDSGRVLVFELNIWAYGKLLLGDRRVHKRAAAEAALNQTAVVQAAIETVRLSASAPAGGSPAELLAAQGTEFAVLLNLTAEVDLDSGVNVFLSSHEVQDAKVVAGGGEVVLSPPAAQTSRGGEGQPLRRAITSTEIFAHQGKRLIIVGDSWGFISVLSSEGLFEHVFMPRPAALATTETTHTAPGKAPHVQRVVRPSAITALAKGTNVLAYSMRKVIGFISVSRQVFQSQMCHAVSIALKRSRVLSPPRTMLYAQTDDIVSLSFDTMARTMLWAGTRSGDVLVFHTRYKLKSGSGQTECKRKTDTHGRTIL